MKKLKGLIIPAVLCLMLENSAAYAAESTKYADFIPSWTDNSANSEGALDYAANIVSVDGRQSVFRLEQKNSYAANTFASFTQIIDSSLLQEGHTYRLEMDLKGEAETPDWVRIRFGTSYDDKSDPYTPNIKNWQHKTMEYTVTDLSKNLRVDLQCPHGKAVFYADSMQVYDISDELRTNILLNGDFDAVNDKVLIKNIKTSEKNGSTVISWDAPSEFIQNIRLYDSGGQEIAVSGQSAEFVPDGETEIIFEVEDIYGNTMRQPKTVLTDFSSDFSEPVIKSDNNMIISETKIKNSVEEAAVVMAVYSGGRLYGAVHAWRKAAEAGNTDTVTLSYRPVESGTYTVKVFILNSMGQMLPLAEGKSSEVLIDI